MEGATTAEKVSEIRRWHIVDFGFADIGYHVLIDRDGTILNGRSVEKTGAHTRGHNDTSLSVCLIGGHGSSEHDAFLDNFTPEQERALSKWITDTRSRFPSIKRVSGHNEYAAKACPGFNVPRWLKGQKPRTSPSQSKTVQASSIGAAVGAGTSFMAVLSKMDPMVQVIIAVGGIAMVAMCAVVFRERLRKWAGGDW
jgi:hypothetical protein